MIQCNTLNPLSECRMSLPGIKCIQLIPYGDILDYTYTDNNLNLITGFNLISLPVELQANNESVFNGELLQGQTVEFQHTLSAIIPIIEQEKRNELDRIINMDLSIIFTDKNGRCWLMGQDRPVRVASYSFGTGKTGGENIYSISFQGQSKYQVRQIACYDGQCFASFNGTEYRQTAFLIPNASAIDFSTGTLLTIAGNDDVFSYTLLADMIPTDWDTSAAQRLDDSIQLNNLIGNPANGQVSQLIYNSGTDEAVIVFSSSDTLYSNLNIGVESGFAVSHTIELNLVLTIAAPLAAAATVTVTDSDLNVVYAGAPNDFLGMSYTGVSGFVNNATINVTELYSAGTTFTAEIEGLDCGTQTYTFIYEPPYECSATSVDSSFLAGRSYELKSVRHSGGTPYFRSCTFYFDGYMFNLYKDEADWHSTPATLKTDVETALALNPALDMQDLLITTTGTGITISFKSSSDSFDCWMLNEGNDDGGSTSHLKSVGTQSNLLHIISTTPPDSSITIEDALGNTADGIYGNAPSSSTFLSETNDSITGTINDYAINANQYLESDDFDVTVDNIVCSDTVETFVPGSFFSGYDSFADGVYQLWRLDMKSASAQSFTQMTLTYTTAGAITSFFPAVTYDTGYDEMSMELSNDLIADAKLLGIYSNEPLQYLYIELYVPNTDTLTSLDINTTGQVVDLLIEEQAQRYVITPYMHPAVNAQYTFHTIDPFTPLVSINAPLQEPLNVTGERIDDEDFIIQLDYDGVDISLSIQNNNTFTGSYTIAFYDDNPLIGTLPLVSYNYPQPTIGASINFTADLAVVLAIPADVTWVSVTIDTGWTEVYEFNPTTPMLVSLGKSVPNRVAWGRHYEFIKVGSFPMTYEITSTEFPTNFNLDDLTSGDMRLHIQAEDLFAQDMTFDTMVGGVNYTVQPYIAASPVGYADGIYIKPENQTSYEYIDTIETFSTGSNEVVFKNTVLHLPQDKVVARANIYSWVDLSDDARGVTGVSSFAPALREVDFTRHNRAAYFASTEYLDVATTSMTTLNDLELFIVARRNDLDSLDIIYDWSADARNAFIQFSIQNTQAELMWKDDMGNTDTINVGGFPLVTGDFNLYHIKVSKDSGTGDITTNIDINSGLSASNTAPSSGLISGITVTQLLCAWFDGVDVKDGFGGDVLEVLMFDSLSPTDLINVTDYLLTKYNITAI